MDGMTSGEATREESLVYGLEYLASMIRDRKVYLVNSDSFAKGDEAFDLMAKFAEDLAADRLKNWRKWTAIARKGEADTKAHRAQNP